MVRATTPKPGDWVGLAMFRKVPGVDRSTPLAEVKAQLLEQIIEGLLAERRPPPGMTADEYRASLYQDD